MLCVFGATVTAMVLCVGCSTQCLCACSWVGSETWRRKGKWKDCKRGTKESKTVKAYVNGSEKKEIVTQKKKKSLFPE